MKRSTDWSTWLSLLAVAAVCIVIGFRMLPDQAPATDPADTKSLLPPRGAEKVVHANAESPSPLAAMFTGDTQPPHGNLDGGPAPSAWAYALASPDRTYELPAALNEISDLAISADSKSLWAVTDELGTVYRIDIADGGIAESHDFGPRGDYEALEQTNGNLVVGASDGLLFLLGGQDGGVRTVDTTLGPACNMEGMAYDPTRRKVLLVCKTEMPKLPKGRKSFAIYAMNVETNAIVREPVIVLPRQAIDDYVGTHGNDPSLKSNMGEEFAPSAIAVHPKTGQLYILSARGAMLVVLEATGTVARVSGLNPIMHPQPEGIAFDAQGTMFISNETRGAHAMLYSYQNHAAPP